MNIMDKSNNSQANHSTMKVAGYNTELKNKTNRLHFDSTITGSFEHSPRLVGSNILDSSFLSPRTGLVNMKGMKLPSIKTLSQF